LLALSLLPRVDRLRLPPLDRFARRPVVRFLAPERLAMSDTSEAPAGCKFSAYECAPV